MQVKDFEKIIVITVALALMAVSCGKIADHAYFIKVKNNSSHAIDVKSGLGPIYSYPDTALSETKPFFVNVSPNDYGYLDLREKWENVFPRLPKDTLSIYVFSSDTLKAYDWSKIRTGYKVLKRYDLSLEDLQKMNWTVTYP